MYGQLQLANGVSGGENLDFINYYYEDVNPVKAYEPVKEKIQEKTDTLSGFEDFMQHPDSIPSYGIKKTGLKKMMNFVNKLNHQTCLLRNGILASMKLDTSHVSGSLRWSYITPNEAQRRGLDIDQWKKLVEVRQRLDSLFYGAGGKPENLKTAILEGQGNWDIPVDNLTDNPVSNHLINQNSSLKELLGSELFRKENVFGHATTEPMETMTTLEVAKGVVEAISKMIRKIGKGINGVFSRLSWLKDNPADNDFTGFFNKIFGIPATKKQDTDSVPPGKGNTANLNGAGTSTPPNPQVAKPGIISKAKSFYNQHKKWIAIAAIGLFGLAAIELYEAIIKRQDKAVDKVHKTSRNVNMTSITME